MERHEEKGIGERGGSVELKGMCEIAGVKGDEEVYK